MYCLLLVAKAKWKKQQKEQWITNFGKSSPFLVKNIPQCGYTPCLYPHCGIVVCSAKIIYLFWNKAMKKSRAAERVEPRCLSSAGSRWPSPPAVYGNLIRNLTVSSKLLCYNNQGGEKIVWTSWYGVSQGSSFSSFWAMTSPAATQRCFDSARGEKREKLVGKPPLL